MNAITTCLWFDRNAEEAAGWYARTFPGGRVTAVVRAPAPYPNGAARDVLMVEFTMLGTAFVGLNGGPQFTFDEAISFQIFTESQAETDRYWEAIVGGGGSAGDCGWCVDRYGVRWQIVPRLLLETIKGADRDAARRAMEAMMEMKKIDVAAIEAAARG